MRMTDPILEPDEYELPTEAQCEIVRLWPLVDFGVGMHAAIGREKAQAGQIVIQCATEPGLDWDEWFSVSLSDLIDYELEGYELWLASPPRPLDDGGVFAAMRIAQLLDREAERIRSRLRAQR